MNKLVTNLFRYLFPFYPLWAYLFANYSSKPIEFVLGVLLLPIALYFVIFVNKKLPNYLIFFILFTVYHLASSFINHAFPKGVNIVYFLLADLNVLACLFFIIIEYVKFDETFIKRMNKNILVIVIISFVVSLIQIKVPSFFYNSNSDEELLYIGESRNFSIYSWANLNSTGTTFPILISLLMSEFDGKKAMLPILLVCGTVVSFLTKARYVMVSIIIVFSQLFFNRKNPLARRVTLLVLVISSILIIGVTANYFGFDIQEVINTRILEKDSDMASAKTRVLSYEVFKSVFPAHPWFGVGPETKKDVIDMLGGDAPVIHVGYLSYLYYYGIAGCLLLFTAVFFLMKEAWQAGVKNNFWAAFYGFATFLAANATFVYFNFSEMGIVLCVLYLRYYKLKPAEEIEDVEFEDVEVVPVNDVSSLQVLDGRAPVKLSEGEMN